MKYKVIKQYDEVPEGTILELGGDQKWYSDNRNTFIEKEVVETTPKHFEPVVEERKPLTADSFFGPQ